MPDVRSANACRCKNFEPDGVAETFETNLKSVEPLEAVRRSRLLAKRELRTAVGDESEEIWEQMSLVVKTFSCACLGERLTRERRAPDFEVVGDADEAEGVGPDAETGKPVGLSGSPNIFRNHVLDASLIDDSGRDQVRGREIS